MCRAIFEAGEKLAAVAAVRDVEVRAAAAVRPGAPRATQLLDDAIHQAGAECTPQVSVRIHHPIGPLL